MNYPFAAIVGQNKLIQALLLCAINPAIGGLLIRGEKGTAKSTAARGLADIIPPLSSDEICGECDIDVVGKSVPFVNLPLGATEDRVLGSLDIEGILNDRTKRLQLGLLAEAHGGILYIDEVNLLPDHLVDVLLDVAAMGTNTVQRDGLSESHPARFTLIGTMNPEEGNLRPQFLDRFGLLVEVEAPRDVEERTEVVRRRIAFENDRTLFIEKWASGQKDLQEKIRAAQQLLPFVTMPEGLLSLISQLCTQLNVTSLRADIVMYKTAVTLAALDKRKQVSAEDIRNAASLVLPHRKQKKPTGNNSMQDDRLDDLINSNKSEVPEKPENQSAPEGSPSETPESDNEEEGGNEGIEQVFGSAPQPEIPFFDLPLNTITPQLTDGHRSYAANTQRGRQVSASGNPATSDISVLATIQQTVLRDPENIQIIRDDLHQKVYSGKTGNLILFLVDASGSMAAGKRMEAVKGSVFSLLTDAYQKRDMVGVISFRGIQAEFLLEPTRSTEEAEKALETLPTGGRTPLPHALLLAKELVQKLNPVTDMQPLLVIVSDGKANVPLPGGGNAWQQTLELANNLKELNVMSLVLDTENEYLRFGKAKELSEALAATYFSLRELSSAHITSAISRQRISEK